MISIMNLIALIHQEEYKSKNKIFLFGATAKGIYDMRVTPFEENFPGPEIHTNIMENLLQKDYLVKRSKWLVLL